MTTAKLKTAVQAKLNAIVYSSGTLQAKQVVQLATEAMGLGLDLTNVISVHNDMTSAIVLGTTSDKDLSALNVGSITLGITSKSIIPFIEGIMLPAVVSYQTSALRIKYNQTTATCDPSLSQFWHYLSTGGTYDNRLQRIGAVLTASAVARQTIMDASDTGILTHVIAPVVLNAETTSIIITLDGVEKVFDFDTIANQRAVLGGVVAGYTTANAGKGEQGDAGWYNQDNAFLLSPRQTVAKGIGLRFEESCKVEFVVASGDFRQAVYGENRAAACYVPQMKIGV